MFACFLLSWVKGAYVIHYGVPIVGHFLEKPEYDAKYRVSRRIHELALDYEDA